MLREELLWAQPVVLLYRVTRHDESRDPMPPCVFPPMVSNAFDLAAVHAYGSARHPFRCGRNHEGEQIGDFFRLSVTTDPHFFRKLSHRLFYTHVMRRRPLLHERAPSSRHHRPWEDTVDLHSVANTLFGKCLRERGDGGINRSDRREGWLRVEGRTARHEYH